VLGEGEDHRAEQLPSASDADLRARVHDIADLKRWIYRPSRPPLLWETGHRRNAPNGRC
jgi:hypothetical protein